jgi:hypothetical protein
MKAIFLSLALGLGMILVGDTGGGSTAPRGSTQDLATGGGSTAPRGSTQDFATGGGSTAPRGSTQDIA